MPQDDKYGKFLDALQTLGSGFLFLVGVVLLAGSWLVLCTP